MQQIEAYFMRSEYGSATITVPDDATDEQIMELAYQAEEDGQVHWCKGNVQCTSYQKIN